MPHITFNIAGRSGHVSLLQNGEIIQLKNVTNINIDEDGICKVTLVAVKTDGHVEVSDRTADAVIRADRRHLLAFLSPHDIQTVHVMRNRMKADPEADSVEINLLSKILHEVSDSRIEMFGLGKDTPE